MCIIKTIILVNPTNLIHKYLPLQNLFKVTVQADNLIVHY